jgi:hypothetical protein
VNVPKAVLGERRRDIEQSPRLLLVVASLATRIWKRFKAVNLGLALQRMER